MLPENIMYLCCCPASTLDQYFTQGSIAPFFFFFPTLSGLPPVSQHRTARVKKNEPHQQKNTHVEMIWLRAGRSGHEFS